MEYTWYVRIYDVSLHITARALAEYWHQTTAVQGETHHMLGQITALHKLHQPPHSRDEINDITPVLQRVQ